MLTNSRFGKYELIAALGRGGMADVFLAADAATMFSKLTVIKRLRENLAYEPEFVAMLLDEARIAARLNHPNVVQTHEVGQCGSRYFLAMEYLDGQPLHRILHRAASRRHEDAAAGREVTDPFEKSLQYVVIMDVLAGLHHAHELNDHDGTPLSVVHRDVNPQNIFVTYDGQVKIVDFGIAKAAGRIAETRDGIVKGKVRYMPTEQAFGQPVDRRADVFAAGVMLWESVTGRRMWQHLEDVEVMQSLLTGQVPSSPRLVDPSVPDGLDLLCRKALAVRPEDRYQSAEEFRSALERHLKSTGGPTSGRRALGRAVINLFATERAEMAALIEKQLSELRANRDVLKMTLLPDSKSTTPTSTDSGPRSGPSSGETRSKTLGKYRLIAELGRGGMAKVYLAVTSSKGMNFSKLVVIKKPREHLAEDAAFMTMFVDEARIAARLNHPNLVQTHEVDEADGVHFLTMEYLDGQPLHRIMSRARATVPLEMHLSILIDILAGIHYAHELKDFDGTPLQIVHRDVTPHNCFVTYEGQVKVVDFGIAKAAGRSSVTQHGVVKGKTTYMAPEQLTGGDIDRRVDIFALGILLFEAVTRRPFWKGTTEVEIVRRLIAGDIPSSPKAEDPSVDDALDQICRRALAARPADRYPTAAAMQRDLDTYLSSKGNRPAPRDIGAYVATLFADKREATEKVIESQLASLRAAGPGGPPSLSLAKGLLESPQEAPGERVSASSAPTEARASTLAVAPEVVRAPPSPRARKSKLLGTVAAVLAAGGIGAIVFALNPDESKVSSPNSAASALVKVTLRASPASATFTIDDGPALQNPFEGQFAADAKEHFIRAVAPGHPAKEERVTFQGDVSVRFTLAPTR